MNEINVKVCDEVGSGTADGYLSLSFRTSFNDTSGSVYENCTTKKLGPILGRKLEDWTI